jgi:hypothetical protein
VGERNRLRAVSVALAAGCGRRGDRVVDNLTAKSPQLLAIAFIQDARAYVESARTLDRVHGDAPRFYQPTYFLLGQAMELVLKAYSSASGVSKRRLRNCVGHDIALAFRYARRFFSFAPTERFGELALWLAPYHRDHSFRYRKSGTYRTLPVASEAAEIILNTVDRVEPFVRYQFLSLREKSRKPASKATDAAP